MKRFDQCGFQVVLAACAGLALAGCAAEVPRDTAGQVVAVAPRATQATREFPVQVGRVFPAGGFSGFERVERDNGMAYVDTVRYRGQLALRYEWFPNEARLGDRDEQALGDRRAFEAFVTRVQRGRAPEQAGIAPVRHVQYQGHGFTYVGPGPSPATACFVGRAGYRVKRSQVFDDNSRMLDSVLSGGFCGSADDAQRFVTLFNTMATTAPQ